MRTLMAVLLIGLATAAPAAELDAILDVLVAAYPDHLARHDGKEVIWQDGTRMPASDGREHKSFEELLDAPSLAALADTDRDALGLAILDAAPATVARRTVSFAPYRTGSAFLVDKLEAAS